MEKFRVAIKKIDKEMTESTNPSIRRLSAVFSGTLIGAMIVGACGNKQPETTKVETNNNQTSENVPSSENLSAEEIAQRTLDDFVKSHPEYKDREAGVVNFIVNDYDASTVVFKTSDEEKDEISKRKYEINGTEVTPFTGAIVWTKKTDFNNKETWVRLAGVQFKDENDSTDTIYTVWYSSPHEDYTKVTTNVDFKQKVFAFNSNDDEYAYWPLINPPTKIVWSEDMTSTNPNEYAIWNGNDPFMLSVDTVLNSGSKALFELVPVVNSEVTLTDKEKQIYSVAPETFATNEGDLQKSWSEKYGMPVYVDKDGNIVAIWLADKRDLSKGSQRETTIKENVLTTIDDRGKEISIYPVVATAELPENEFNKVKIYTNGEKFRENPVLSQEQLPAMRDYLIELYNTKQLRQFEIGERGAMQLGPSYDKTPDFVMNPDNTAFINENGYQPMFVVQENERKEYRWEDPDTRPIVVAFPYSEGGVIFAQLILDKNSKVNIMGWSWMNKEWLDLFNPNEGLVQGIVNYESNATTNLENVILVPQDIADANKYIEYRNDYSEIPPLVSELIKSMENTRTQRRNLYKQMIETGTVPESISSGEIISIWGGSRVTR